jgi:hypothetical protein
LDDLLVYGGIVLAVFVGVLVAVVVSQRARMKRFEAKLGVSGIGLTVELSDLVKKEVARVSLASLGRIARVDRELIDFWEKERTLSAEDSSKRLDLIAREVLGLEARLNDAPPEDAYHLAVQLRELYWKHLQFGRLHWGSSSGYQVIRAGTIKGLERIEKMAAGDVIPN